MRKIKKGKKKYVVLFILVFIGIIIGLLYLLSKAKIKNIYIYDNKILKDQEIIELANLEEYPSFLKTPCYKVKKKIKTNEYVKDVKVTKGFLSINIYVAEHDPLFINGLNNKVVLENGKEINNTKNLTLPTLINAVEEEEYKKFINKFTKMNDSIREKISEIKYDPNDYDKDRFLFLMNDKNYVYVTLTKIDYINKYDEMVTKFEGKNGILYLDSGNYFEIK